MADDRLAVAEDRVAEALARVAAIQAEMAELDDVLHHRFDRFAELARRGLNSGSGKPEVESPMGDDALILADGSHAEVLPNGRIVSGISGLAEFTDSDGTVYKIDGPTEERVREHRAAVLKFRRSPRYWHRRLNGMRRRRAARTARPRFRPRARRPAARRAAGPRSGADPGDDGPGEPAGPLADSAHSLREAVS